MTTNAYLSQAIASFIRQKHFSPTRSTLALRDYWPWWRQNVEVASAGKLVPSWSSSDGSSGKPLYAVVFDDNIRHDDAHIIDIRDGEGQPIRFDQVIGKNLVRAEPYWAIRDPSNYFKNEMVNCLAKLPGDNTAAASAAHKP